MTPTLIVAGIILAITLIGTLGAWIDVLITNNK